VVARLNAEINAALNDEQVKTSMRNLGVEPAPGTAKAFDDYIRAETRKWAKVIKTANIKLD
jgi:tripartite-type tricarboxylate transporter receptor subunit TctC